MKDRSKRYISDEEIQVALDDYGFIISVDEGRLLLAELVLKASAGFYNSHTEEIFLAKFGIIRKDRLPTKKGRKFVAAIFYRHSSLRPEGFTLMRTYRLVD